MYGKYQFNRDGSASFNKFAAWSPHRLSGGTTKTNKTLPLCSKNYSSFQSVA